MGIPLRQRFLTIAASKKTPSMADVIHPHCLSTWKYLGRTSRFSAMGCMYEDARMTQTLIVFGNQTADEIVSAAEKVGGDQFNAIRKFVFHEQIGSDPEFKKFVQSHSNLSYIIGMTDVRMKPRVQAFADEIPT